MKPNTISHIMGRLILQENGCAIWPGMLHSQGYGMTRFHGRSHLVHRLLYEHFVGPVPEGLVLDHLHCDNRACANWAHLSPCSRAANTMRGQSPAARNARKTHCSSGHAYADGNLFLDSRGARICRICRRERRRESAARVRAGTAKPRTPRAEPMPKRPRTDRILEIMLCLKLQPNGCALWPRAKQHGGYGVVEYERRSRVVHRLLYEHLVGPVPPGLVLDHQCDTPACANVAHLKPATDRENLMRGHGRSAMNARKTHCCHGHPFEGKNVGRTPAGHRYCQQCNRDKSNARYHDQREAAGLTVGLKTRDRTHCPQGHAYDGANLIVDPNGWRSCRACNQAHDRDRYARKKAAQQGSTAGVKILP